MPTFDQHCTACAWTAEIVAQPHENPPCPQCGQPTERLWVSSARVNGDEIPGGVWIENLGPRPLYFESKSEIAREAKRRGLEPMVRHVPVPGSDKSPHTTNWAAVSPYQLDAATQMVSRMGRVTPPPSEPADVGPVATPEMVAEALDSWAR